MYPYLLYRGRSLHSGREVTKDRECGTVGCIHGWGDVLFKTDGDADRFRSRLGIGSGEYNYMAYGGWRPSLAPSDLGKREVIKYMTKALKEKNVMVSI